jgi:type II secretory pathway pseudopilin PulG
MQSAKPEIRRDHEQGFMLIGVIVLVFLVMLALSVAAPKVAQDLRRDREVEAIHRGNEYVRALQLYYKKFGRYPGNMDQLEKSNNIRFLRQKYVDPLTGKADWRLIHVGEAKTTVKGFFGQPLAGLPGGGGTGGLGSAAGMVSAQPTTTVSGSSSPSSPTGSTGFSLGSGVGASSGSGAGAGSMSGPGGSTVGGSTGTPGTTAAGSTPGTGGSSSGFGGIGSQSATSFTGGGAPIVGIGSSKTGSSITELNEQTTYQTWEFLYDPRIEQMKAKAALLGGPASNGFGSSGSMGGSNPLGGSSPSSPNAPMSPSPTSPGTSSPGGSNPYNTSPR